VWRRAAVAIVVLATLLFSADTSDPHSRYLRWHREHAAEVGAYADFLAARGVGSVVPMRQLLRTGRSWRKCGEEFAVPPRDAWPAIVPTLQLLAHLRGNGLLAGSSRVDSAWRSPPFNACAGGAPRSRHVTNGALDLEWISPPGGVETLCAAWRRDGPAHAWGLGFYSPTRIHLDTAGFRSWGKDHHWPTSLCIPAG
jgi:hypothetical protein